VGARIGRMMHQGIAGQQLAARAHQASVRRQLRTHGQPRFQPLHRPRPGKKIVHQPPQGRIPQFDHSPQRLQRPCRSAGRREPGAGPLHRRFAAVRACGRS